MTKKYSYIKLKMPYSSLSNELRGKMIAMWNDKIIRISSADLGHFNHAKVIEKEIAVHSLKSHNLK